MIKKYKLLIIIMILFINPTVVVSAVEDDVAELIQRVTALETPVIENDATVVYLKKACSNSDNCFTNLLSLQNWINNTRNPKPSSSNPLLVEIGPGVFQGTYECINEGYVTLRGAGMKNTILENSQAGRPVITTDNCFNLTFSDLTIRNGYGSLYATRNNGGSTTWDNIEINAEGYGWVDDETYNCNYAKGTHYWFNSRIIASTNPNYKTARAYYSACDESWIFGSEITAFGTLPNSIVPNASITAQDSTSDGRSGEVHVYGSVIRSIAKENAINNPIYAVRAQVNAEIHIHGTGIDVISDENNNITALYTNGSGMIHAHESSYVLKTNGGIKTRIQADGGNINAPFDWGPRTEPPLIISQTGADTYIETDCLKDLKCSWTPDHQHRYSHFMIYREECTGTSANEGPWYDTVTKECRQ